MMCNPSLDLENTIKNNVNDQNVDVAIRYIDDVIKQIQDFEKSQLGF